MTGRYKAYPEYKDSGKNYYGEVPNHWVLQKIKHNSYVKGRQGWQNLRADEYQDEGPILVTGSHFDKNGGVDWEKCYHVSEERYSRDKDICLQEGDVLLTKDGTIGKIAFIDQLPDKACLNSHLLIIRDLYQRYNQRYLYHLLNSDCFKGFIPTRQTGTTFMGITQESVEEFPLIICPLNEQQKIVNFLDHETAKIDTLIAKQEKLIELLKEKRQAVISHAVTRGLNPNAPMKESGSLRIGKVPEHWKVGSLRWYLSVNSGEYLNNKEFEIIEDGKNKYPVVGGNGTMGFSSKFNDEDIIVLGRVGALCGNVHHYTEKCWVTDNALKIDYSSKYKQPFMEVYLRVLNLNSLANHNAQPLITGTMVKDQIAIVPSTKEQLEIVQFVELQSSKMDKLIDKATKAIAFSKERKTALISAAVTGKIDVRNWQPSGSEEVA